MSFEKTVLESGSGAYRPNKLARVVLDVTGKWTTEDGDSVTFYAKENETMELGAFYLEKPTGIEALSISCRPGQ